MLYKQLDELLSSISSTLFAQAFLFLYCLLRPVYSCTWVNMVNCLSDAYFFIKSGTPVKEKIKKLKQMRKEHDQLRKKKNVEECVKQKKRKQEKKREEQHVPKPAEKQQHVPKSTEKKLNKKKRMQQRKVANDGTVFMGHLDRWARAENVNPY